MINPSPNALQLIYARVAGFSYVAVILLGIFSVSFIDTSIIVAGDASSTVNNIVENELRFRISVAGEIVMYALVILLSLSLYVVLKSVNEHMALLALLWRLAEAIVGVSVAVVSGLIPLLLVEQSTVNNRELLQTLVAVFLDIRNSGLDFVLLFVGIGGTIFCFLFLKSNYVPRILAIWGILTYLSMLVLSISSLLLPNISETTKMVFFVPGGLFEIIFGLWLLIKGLNFNGVRLS